MPDAPDPACWWWHQGGREPGADPNEAVFGAIRVRTDAPWGPRGGRDGRPALTETHFHVGHSGTEWGRRLPTSGSGTRHEVGRKQTKSPRNTHYINQCRLPDYISLFTDFSPPIEEALL
jgi:hypothetical protein